MYSTVCVYMLPDLAVHNNDLMCISFPNNEKIYSMQHYKAQAVICEKVLRTLIEVCYIFISPP